MTKLKRTTHKPEGFTYEQMQGFSLLSHKASAQAITNRLTGSQFRLWHYLMMVDPFADSSSSGERVYHDIPSPIEIGRAIGANPKTVEIDMRRLEQLGLYAKRVTSWQGYNLTAEEAHRASAAMKQAKAERAAQSPVKQRPLPPATLKTPTVQDQKSLKPLQDKRCYLTPDGSYLTPKESYLTPDGSYLTPRENPKTTEQQEVQAFPAPDQTIQTNLDTTDNLLADKKNSGEKKEEEVSQGVGDSGVYQEVEPTGILEEPQPDPTTQAQQATAQLLDEREVYNDLRRLGIETNETVRAVMKKFKANVPDAIAHIRQRYDNHERFKNVTGAFVKACQEGAKPRSTTRTQVNPPTVEQICLLQSAKDAREIRDFYPAPWGSDEVITVEVWDGPALPWWEYLDCEIVLGEQDGLKSKT